MKISGLFIGLAFVSSLLLTGCPKDSRNVFTSTTPAVVFPATPPAPTQLTAIAHDGSIALSWSSSEAKHRVHYATASFAGSAITDYPLIVGYKNFQTTSDTSIIIKGLTNGTEYYFIVNSIKNGKESGVKIETSAIPVSPPAAPTALTATPSHNQVILDWSSDEAMHQVHYARESFSRKNIADYKSLSGYNSVAADTATRTVVQGLTNGTVYFFVVTSIKGAQESAASTVASARAEPPPVAPTALTATPSHHKVTLNWVSNEAYHQVHYARESFTGKTIAEYAGLTDYKSITADTATSAVVQGLTNNREYFFVVTSIKGVQESVASVEKSAMPVPPPPTPPSELVAVPAYTRVKLDWLSDETKYQVHYATESFSGYAVADYSIVIGHASLDVTSGTSAIVSNLTNDASYYFVVTSFNENGEESRASNEVIALPGVVLTGKLNDTGITFGGEASNNNEGSCTGETIEGQDCSDGRDAQSAAGELQKIGAGAAGFDFTKLASDGTLLAIQDQSWSESGTEMAGTKWSCVLDNVTGFIWAVKTDDDGLHDKDDTYDWDNSDFSSNGGFGDYGNPNEDTCFGYNAGEAKTYCNTEAYVARVNQESLCGANDWRMPTFDELYGIVYKGRRDPAIDTDFFPNTLSTNFCSSTPSGSGKDYTFWRDNVIGVSFVDGDETRDRRNTNFSVRLLRDGQ